MSENVSEDYVNFNSTSEDSDLSYKNRIENIYKYSNFIYNNIAFRNGFVPTDDVRKFLKLRAKTSISDDVVKSSLSAVSSNGTSYSSDDAATIANAVENMEASEFVQLFLDSYMSPTNSDIQYRLGNVTSTKIFSCDYKNGTVIYDDDKDNLDALAQYDKYGRLDTTSNFRKKTHIDGFGSTKTLGVSWSPRFHFYYNYSNVIAPYDEYYINWFFPPFSNTGFGNTSTSNIADYNIRNRRWVDVSIYKDKTCPKCGKTVNHWCYPNSNFDLDNYTYDTQLLLSLRDKPTYRKVAFKSLNDNISYLQYVFEQCSGIVSTYLTEWDISLYIQEGFLSDKYGEKPSIISLCNRIMKDNPSEYKNSNAFSYGVLNAAVSKTPLEGTAPNKAEYNPGVYPLSMYWWPYKSVNRGDGLDQFYTVAKNGFNENEFQGKSLRNQILFYDQIGAAYSGWYNWKTMKNWQALYTWGDDGFSNIDIVHMGESTNDYTFQDLGSGDNLVEGEISQIVSTLYDNDDDLGFPDEEWDEETSFKKGTKYYKLRKHYKMNTNTGLGIFQYAIRTCINDDTEKDVYYKTEAEINENAGTVIESEGDSSSGDNSVDIDADDIKILGIRLRGSSILKLFLKKNSIKDSVMGIATKSKSNYSTTSSSSSSTGSSSGSSSSGTSGSSDSSTEYGDGVETGTGSDTESSSNLSSASSGVVSMLTNDDSSNGQYSRQEGVSQWSPSLYGGPHGRYLSPKTVQGYLEEDNEFLRNVPRYNNHTSGYQSYQSKNFDISSENSKFIELEKFYKPTDGTDVSWHPNANRSPVKDMNVLNNGCMDYTTQVVRVYRKFYTTVDVSYHWVGWWFWGHWEENRPSTWNGHRIYYMNSYLARYYSSTGYVTPYSRVCVDYNRCPHYYGTGYYEYNNYYRYSSSDTWYVKDYYGTMYNSYQYNNYYGRYYGNPYYRQPAYLLKRSYFKKRYFVYYYDWSWQTYKRPLMHSNPNEYWSINKTHKYTISTHISGNNWWSRALSWVYWWFGRRSSFGIRYSYTYNEPEEVYRLIFPRSGISDYRSVVQLSGANYPYIVSREERNFIDNVLGNTSTSHKAIFFASTNDENYRNIYGPDLIFTANCRLDTYNYKYRRQHWYSYRHRCHTDWDWYWEEGVGTASYIRVDYINVPYNSITMSGFMPDNKSQPFSNLGITKSLEKSRRETYQDIPPDSSKSILYSTPRAIEENTPIRDRASFGGYSVNYGDELGFHGWGYTTCLPGLMPSYDSDGTPFENPNEYLNISYKFGSYTKNLSFNSLISYRTFPFYQISPYARAAYPSNVHDSNVLFTCGVRGYSRWGNSQKINGLMYALRNYYTTSTFYKYDETASIESYLKPCIIKNDCQLRSAVRIALHQESYLKDARDVFVNNIDFDSVVDIIENKIDKTILNKTLKTSSNRDTNSIYYHYWIDAAYDFFTDPNNKNKVRNGFNRKIGILQSFINSTKNVINKEIGMWSYNDVVKSYNSMATLDYYKNITNSTTDNIEDYMYMYMQVLYEYRKYFINKRCNKIDGTLWAMRELEGAIPSITTKISNLPDNDNGDKGGGETSLSGENHQYKVDFYRVENSNSDKISAAVNKTTLNKDRTMVIYIKVKYISDQVATDYLSSVKKGTWSEIKKGRYVYIKNTQKWAELPFDGCYRYVSKEYSQALADTKYNTKQMSIAEKNGTTPTLRTVSDTIDGVSNNKCVFNISWSTGHGGLLNYQNAKDNGYKYFKVVDTKTDKISYSKTNRSGYTSLTLSNYLNKYDRFAYVYDEKNNPLDPISNGKSYPTILFSVTGGIDLTKVKDAMAVNGSSMFDNPQNTICSIQTTDDYWCITIPTASRPRVVGYMNNLKIKTETTSSVSSEAPTDPNTTLAGSMGYALYPITEEQANTMPGIGLSMEEISANIKSQYTSDLT